MPHRLTNTLILAQGLIACESITPEHAGCFDLIEQWLEELGFQVWRVMFEEDGYAPTENLYARYGTAAPNIALAGHVDVVPVGDAAQWRFPPFQPTVQEGVLYGRGAEDMKGAIAAMISAVAELITSGAWDAQRGSISFLLTADEEGIAINGTPKLLNWLSERGEKLDYCLVGEPTNPDFLGQMCKIGRRGSLLCQLTVEGTQGHVAYPERADNPITTLVNMLHVLKSTVLDTGNAFFPSSNLEVTTIDVGNHAHNMIPARAFAEFNIRFNSEYTGAALIEKLRSLLDSIGKPYTLTTRISGESFLTQRGVLSEALTAAIEKHTGHTPDLSTTGGTSDARFIKDHCPVIEFGTTGKTPHKIDECVEVAVLEGLHRIYAAFLLELVRRHHEAASPSLRGGE